MFANHDVEENPQDDKVNLEEPAPDLEELANKVFKLLLQELALENDRSGRN